MAEAKGHKFGQGLGEYCQRALEPMLSAFAKKHGLFLDKAGVRSARKGKKVKWVDGYGNAHDLDYVLERNGSATQMGTPLAFIESAWRRYTKHSKNKAQEIQGAVMPVRDRYHYSAPFMGCVLVGLYTSTAQEQLRRLGFHILYFEYQTVLQAFKTVGIDASFDEDTEEIAFADKQKQWGLLNDSQRQQVWEKLIELNKPAVDAFMTELERCVKRQIATVRVIPLHGTAFDCTTITQAIDFISKYDEKTVACYPVVKYEVQIRYDNGDKVDGQFQDRQSATDFLNHYHSGNWTPIVEAEEEDLFKILEEVEASEEAEEEDD